MIAAEIAEALGGARRSGRWWRCRCPVHSSHSATLALRNKRGGHLVVVCHAGCSRIDILAELTQRGLTSHDFGIPTEPEIASAVLDDDGSRRIALARRIWDRTRSAAGTPVAAYLRAAGSRHRFQLRCAGPPRYAVQTVATDPRWWRASIMLSGCLLGSTGPG